MRKVKEKEGDREEGRGAAATAALHKSVSPAEILDLSPFIGEFTEDQGEGKDERGKSRALGSFR